LLFQLIFHITAVNNDLIVGYCWYVAVTTWKIETDKPMWDCGYIVGLSIHLKFDLLHSSDYWYLSNTFISHDAGVRPNPIDSLTQLVLQICYH